MLASRSRLASILAGSVLALTAGVGSAAAHAASHYTFYDCSGSSPASFTATKTVTSGIHGVSAAAAFHIVGTDDVFVVLGFGELGHGPATSGRADVACFVDTQQGTFTFYGFIAPAD